MIYGTLDMGEYPDFPVTITVDDFFDTGIFNSSIGDLFTAGLFPGGAKPGDVQYGVWAFAALDAFFQTVGPSGKWSVIASGVNALLPGQPMKVGRSQAYLRDLKAYDKKVFDKTCLQQNLF